MLGHVVPCCDKTRGVLYLVVTGRGVCCVMLCLVVTGRGAGERGSQRAWPNSRLLKGQGN